MLTSLNSTAKLMFKAQGGGELFPPNDVTISSLTSNSVTITFTAPECKFDQYIYYLCSELTTTINQSSKTTAYTFTNSILSSYLRDGETMHFLKYINEKLHIPSSTYNGNYYLSGQIIPSSNGYGTRYNG